MILIKKVRITYLKSGHVNTCYLTNEHLELFGLSKKTDNMLLRFGSASLPLKKVIVNDNNFCSTRLYLSKDIEIYIPTGMVFQVKKINEQSLELGPLIGVFISQEKFSYISSGKNIAAYVQFATTCKKLFGLCCFFSISSINWTNKLVKGLMRTNSEWIDITLPLPRVIYDQNHHMNCRTESIELRRRLDHEYHVLNSIPRLSKFETINALRKNPSLVNLIPETTLYKSSVDVETALQKYSRIYLKPNSLSKGKGIFRITKISEHQYRIEYRTTEQNHIVNLQTLDVLDNLLNKYSIEGEGYIIQQEIQKASFRGNPFDFRLLYQKDYRGSWKPSGIVGRIASLRSVITSPRSGGMVEEFSIILKEVFNEDLSTSNGLYENIIQLGKEICLSIEHEFGNCAELGLDMALDVKQKIWVIEVNGKPLKVSLKRLNNPGIILLYNRRPIEYSVYLAGLQSADTELDSFE